VGWTDGEVSAFLGIGAFCVDLAILEVFAVLERISFGKIIKKIVSNRKGAQIGLKERIFILSSDIL
jgi:hypothetical protein